MIFYCGQTRSAKWIARARACGWGEMVQPSEWPPRRPERFALDNGAFVAWRKGLPFDAEGYGALLEKVRASGLVPDFLIAPDVVAGGAASLELSLEWADRCRTVGPTYLAVQDGMTEAEVRAAVARGGFAGLFVGGTLEWKLATMAAWAWLTRELGIRCHVGRVGTGKRVRTALLAGVDSCDSCVPLFSDGNWSTVDRALRDGAAQAALWCPDDLLVQPRRAS